MVIVLLAKGFEELEALTPVDILRRSNIDIRTVSITDDKDVTGTHGIRVTADLSASEVPLDELKMLILPGGMPGVSNLDSSPHTHRLVDAVLRNGGHLAAICAAPSIFGRHGMLTNIKATCFPGFEDQLHGAIITDSDVVTDGIFTTARDYTAASAFSHRLIEILSHKDEPSEELSPFPPLELLTHEEKYDEGSGETERGLKLLYDIFERFKIKAKITLAGRGPSVTKYNVRPEAETAVRSVTGLLDDIQLAFGKAGIRMEAPIPGKTSIGIEIPNDKRTPVRLRGILEEDAFNKSSLTSAVIGRDALGEAVIGDIAKFPHALISGTTGSGKSIFISSLLASILYKAKPSEVKLLLIDTKRVEFSALEGLPHLIAPVIYDARSAVGTLLWAREEMERRFELISSRSVRSIDALNEVLLTEGKEPLAKIIIVIDELADLMLACKKEIEENIMLLAQKSRAAGIHLIILTQKSDTRVVTGAVKANIPTRISFKMSCAADSLAVMGARGAERLLSCGDMLYHPVRLTSPIRVSSAYISDEEMYAIATYIKERYPKGGYDPRITERISTLAFDPFAKKDIRSLANEEQVQPESFLKDPLFREVCEFVVNHGKASTALIQRKFSIGYGKAAKFIDAMEELGIVGAPMGQKPRDVLVDLDALIRIFSDFTV